MVASVPRLLAEMPYVTFGEHGVPVFKEISNDINGLPLEALLFLAGAASKLQFRPPSRCLIDIDRHAFNDAKEQVPLDKVIAVIALVHQTCDVKNVVNKPDSPKNLTPVLFYDDRISPQAGLFVLRQCIAFALKTRSAARN